MIPVDIQCLVSCLQSGFLPQQMGAGEETHSQILCGERESKLDISVWSLHFNLREPYRRWGGRVLESEEKEDTRRTWSTKSTKQGSYRFTETEVASTGPT